MSRSGAAHSLNIEKRSRSRVGNYRNAHVAIDRSKTISVAKLKKALAKTLHDVAGRGEEIFVLRDNELAAVIMPAGEYEILKKAADLLEHLTIAGIVRKRLERHDREKNVSWEKVKRALSTRRVSSNAAPHGRPPKPSN